MLEMVELITSHKTPRVNLPKRLAENIDKWELSNVGMSYRYFDDCDVAEWIEKNCESKICDAFSILNTGAGRADLFRIAYLFKHGGIWHDADLPAFSIYSQSSRMPLLLEEASSILIQNRRTGGYRYTLICSKPKTVLFNTLLDRICSNILAGYGSGSVQKTIFLTGPFVLGKIVEELFRLPPGEFLPLSAFSVLGDEKVFYSEDIVPARNSYEEENTIEGYTGDLNSMGVVYHDLIPGVMSRNPE